MRGSQASPKECVSLRLYYKVRDPRSTPNELVRGPLALPKQNMSF